MRGEWVLYLSDAITCDVNAGTVLDKAGLEAYQMRSPAWKSRRRASWTCRARPFMTRRISVRPTASQIHFVIGLGYHWHKSYGTPLFVIW